jgi:hypothetical protein
MRSKPLSVTDEAQAHDREFHAIFSAAKQARARLSIRPHRAITPLNVTPSLMAQGIVLPIVLCGLIVWFKPFLFDFWRQCILFWSSGLHLPFSVSTRINDAGQFGLQLSGDLDGGQLPNATILAVTALVTAIAFALSFRMKNASFPLRYPLRIACVVQFATLVYFWWTPTGFPYNIARHSEELMTIGYVVMLATPLMLAMGYYILNQSLLKKLFYTGLILAFLAIMVPHQVLIQALIMQHLSVLFMPLLYICFGAVFDALVFVALYSWIASNAPANATV